MLKDVKIKFVSDEAKQIYNYGEKLKPSTDFSAGIDLRVMEDIKIDGGETVLVNSGIAIFINNKEYCAKIYPRSGLGHKDGIVLGNLTGIIDADYQGEIKVSLWNRSSSPKIFKKGDRISQLIFTKVYHPNLIIVDNFEEETLRNIGGFGSSGHK